MLAARAHGLPKIHWVHGSKPKFRAIFDTTGTPQNSVGLVYCTHHNSYIPWTHQITWIKSLTPWISRICSPYKLSSGTGFIRKKELWNGFSSSHGLIKLHGSKVWHLGYHRYVLPVSYLLELVTSGNKHREMVSQNL